MKKPSLPVEVMFHTKSLVINLALGVSFGKIIELFIL